MHSTLVGNAEEDALRRMEQEDQFRQLQQALQRLNETDRLLLVLYYFEDRSYEEIQAISGLSYKVLKTRLSRARQRLRAWLGEAS
jgi:RNA polymerase sigma-70 factor (ECF subfamily)